MSLLTYTVDLHSYVRISLIWIPNVPRSTTLLSIVIGSPSDVPIERQLIADIIERWNAAHSKRRSITLEPVRWETHAHPQLGDRPQSIINSQIIDDADILVAVFWTRLGTDTGVAPSGTAEEIQRFVDAKKPVLLYFSERPAPLKNLDIPEYQRLEQFRHVIEKKGLLSSFSDIPDLERRFTKDLASILNSVVLPNEHTRSLKRRSRGAVGTYDRQATFNAAVQSAPKGPLMRGDRYTRSDIITSHGDVRILETYEGVVSYSGQPISKIPTIFRSSAGRQLTWRCQSSVPGQTVDWEWDPETGAHSEGRFVFDPPLGSRPVSFFTERYVVNGISFTRQERMQATDGREREEALPSVYRHVWEECMFNVKFPEYRFPKTFSVLVLDANREPHSYEAALVTKRLKAWPETQALSFAIAKPIPGFTYSIRWELPEDSSSQLSAMESGFVDEITRRLLGLRNGGELPRTLHESLNSSRRHLRLLLPESENSEIAVALYVYDRQKSGLVCVATVDALDVEANWKKFFFKPGRGVAGRAFRRRAVEISTLLDDNGEPTVIEKIDGQEPPPSCIVCVPLFLRGRNDRVMAIISFEAMNADSCLSDLLRRPSAREEIGKHFDGWYEDHIADSIVVSGARDFWKI